MSGAPANLFILDSAAEPTAFDISDPELLRMLEASQASHFWFPARNRQILQFLRRDGIAPPARILEVGCGTGTVLSDLARAGYRMTGVEMHPELARRAAAANPSVPIYSLNLFSAPEELAQYGGFDAVALFDVVEHLDDPASVLRACAALLAPGGSLVGTLPALAMLWSDYDRFAGHRLRYDRRALFCLFGRAGLPRPRASYFFQALLPGMLVRRAVVGRGRADGDAGADADAERRDAQHLALDVPSRPVNAVFAAACAAERAIRRALPLDAVPGTSLWFSTRIREPRQFSAATPPTTRTGGTP
jgi:SAM-dependent methyltransferase